MSSLFPFDRFNFIVSAILYFWSVMAMSRARHTEIFCIEGSERWKQHSKFVPGRGRMKWRGGRASRIHLPENQVPPKEDEQIILLCFTEKD
ncbi:hypothetical protein NA56DRAFT_643874 [Hyaloscypha hepaticicola]|uniref:Uncharacterized protein n=1 Tax=Hyaloscypha hepaticicola TaxID=2082293 RepID=A0A2J6QBZ8_9HELO|nr:hypothetical protein NA56DRAFT_643874 [Hyaloscypha hepaticicola]